MIWRDRITQTSQDHRQGTADQVAALIHIIGSTAERSDETRRAMTHAIAEAVN